MVLDTGNLFLGQVPRRDQGNPDEALEVINGQGRSVLSSFKSSAYMAQLVHVIGQSAPQLFLKAQYQRQRKGADEGATV